MILINLNSEVVQLEDIFFLPLVKSKMFSSILSVSLILPIYGWQPKEIQDTNE